MHKISQYNRDKLIDLLTERLTFERSGVKLYDAVLDRMRQSSESIVQKMLPRMEHFRREEKEHEEWLEEQIRDLGGDVHATTEMARLVETESEGIEKVILDGDPEIPHLFHALLAAELSDNAGWEILVKLAEDADDEDARKQFRRFLHEEEDHLDFVREAMHQFAKAEVVGERPQSPDQAASP